MTLKFIGEEGGSTWDMHVYTHIQNMVLNLPATVSLVVLLFPPPPIFLHVTSTIVVNVAVNLDVSVIDKLEMIALHRTVLYGPEDLGTPVGELNRYCYLRASSSD